MNRAIEAVFDGQMLHPTEPLALEPNTRVRLTLEPVAPGASSFLETARSLSLEGPPDWSANLHKYLR